MVIYIVFNFRAAAARCRLKKKVWVTNLEQKAEDLQSANDRLEVCMYVYTYVCLYLCMYVCILSYLYSAVSVAWPKTRALCVLAFSIHNSFSWLQSLQSVLYLYVHWHWRNFLVALWSLQLELLLHNVWCPSTTTIDIFRSKLFIFHLSSLIEWEELNIEDWITDGWTVLQVALTSFMISGQMIVTMFCIMMMCSLP